MKTVRSFGKPEEAHLLRAHLEGSGIPAFVRDDHTVTADWALSNAIGGVKVEVAEDDYEEALSVIAEFAPPPPATDEKKAHALTRYLKIAAVAFVLSFVFVALKTPFLSAGVMGYFYTALVAGGFAGMVGLLCAILDL